MTDRTQFNPYQLRVGDQCLVQLGKIRERGEVIIRGKTHLSPVIVRLESGHVVTFNSKDECPYRVVAGARNVEGNWVAL